MSSKGASQSGEQKGRKTATDEVRPRRTVPAAEEDEEVSWDEGAVPMDLAKGPAAAADDDEDYEEELEEKIPAEMRKLIKNKADGKYLLGLNELEREEELDRRFTAYRKRMELEELENMESGAKDKDVAASKKRRLSKAKEKESVPAKKGGASKKRAKPATEEYEDDIDNEQWDEILADSDDEEAQEEEDEEEEEEDGFGGEEEEDSDLAGEEEDSEAADGGRARRSTTRRASAKSARESKLDELAAARRAGRPGARKDRDDSSIEEGELSDEEVVKAEELVDDSPIGELKDFLVLQVKRSFLEQNHHEPWFENAVVGQFVRVAIPGMSDGSQQYRMAEVIGIVPSSREYQLGPHRINKQLEVQIGKARKTFRMIFVSEHRFTAEEFDFYKTHQLDARVPLLTQQQTQQRRRRFKKAVFEHKYTQEEINRMVGERDIATTLASKDFTSVRKELADQLEEARQVENFDVMDELQKKLRKLDEHWSVAQMASKHQNDALRQINERNKRQNWIEDITRPRNAAGTAQRAVAKDKQTDAFARRQVRPKTLWVTNSAKSSASQQQGAEESKGSGEDHATATAALARQTSTSSSILGVEIGDDGMTQLTDDVIELRYGFNPNTIPPVHARPLGNRFSSISKITNELPPKESEARESLRKQLGGMSLGEYLNRTKAPVH